MSGCYLGVDIGASKSHALICDDAGTILGFAQAGAGNHEQVGYDGLSRVLDQIVTAALTSANLAPGAIDGAGFGVCGYDWESERAAHVQVLDTLMSDTPYALVNDSVIGLIAGAQDGVGVCVIAGTSCNACGRAADGRQGKTIGMGQMLGEAGGGGELVTRALWAVAHDYIRMGAPTRLTAAFVQAFNAPTTAQFIEDYTEGRVRVDAAYAPLVFQIAREGDPVAQALIRWTGTELGALAKAVMRQLHLGDAPFDLVLAGGYFKGSPAIIEALCASVAEYTDQARVVHLDAPPVIGGVLLGMETGGCPTSTINHARVALQSAMRASASG
ncbi:MAG: BadF/BadG/BcrA/BcrD ATPase family protein [Chloroflexota bacterium]|nr:BadF/BadG/BcrA/BcrD ATPase family protein [Chloroflexota bacterium]